MGRGRYQIRGAQARPRRDRRGRFDSLTLLETQTQLALRGFVTEDQVLRLFLRQAKEQQAGHGIGHGALGQHLFLQSVERGVGTGVVFHLQLRTFKGAGGIAVDSVSVSMFHHHRACTGDLRSRQKWSAVFAARLGTQDEIVEMDEIRLAALRRHTNIEHGVVAFEIGSYGLYKLLRTEYSCRNRDAFIFAMPFGGFLVCAKHGTECKSDKDEAGHAATSRVCPVWKRRGW